MNKPTQTARVTQQKPTAALPTFSRVPGGTLQRACACGQHTGGGGECAECRRKREKSLQRMGTGAGPASGVPAIVHDVLGSPGQTLDTATRGYMEPRFGRDFSQVRVHVDAKAAASAQAVNAQAYTVGRNVVFGAGKFAPQSEGGRRLIAHELTHVVQQDGFSPAAGTELAIRESAESENEAHQAARQIGSDQVPVVRPGTGPAGMQRLSCDSILNAQENMTGGRVSGDAAHDAIQADFLKKAGSGARKEFSIPTSSSTAYRSDGKQGDDSIIDPQSIGGRAGTGRADLAYKSGRTMEVGEIKPGSWPLLVQGETQVNNYVEKGNSPELKDWRKKKGLSSIRKMDPKRYTPTSPQQVQGKSVTVGWCEPGVVVYKAIKAQAEETFLCGTLSDKGTVDRFLDKAMDKAQEALDQRLDKVLDPAITKSIQSLSIPQVVDLILKYGGDALAKYMAEKYGVVGGAVSELVPQDGVSASLGEILKQLLGESGEQVLRAAAMTLKGRIITALRQQLKATLREGLQKSLQLACAAEAAKAAVTLEDLLKQFQKDLPGLIGPALVPVMINVIDAAAKEMALGMAKALGAVLAAVAVVALFIFFLPEEGIGAVIAALGALVRALVQGIIALGPQIAALGASAFGSWVPSFAR